jgi:polysaccharide export outer membrane protein
MNLKLPRQSMLWMWMLFAALAAAAPAAAQPPAQDLEDSAAAAAPIPPPVARISGVPSPRDYVIGPDDVLSVVFWRDKEMSAEVVVRPDGKITLPLLNDVDAAGLTPQQLRDRIEEAAHTFVSDATATIVLKQINSRKVFVTGAVEHPGAYPLNTPTTVLQMIATAGGLKEYADSRHIVVMRTEGRVQASYFFDYKSVTKHKKLSENVFLLPGDTLVVP